MTVTEQIDELANLKQGWNSYGASAISPASIEQAKAIWAAAAEAGMPEPSAVPTAPGGVQLEWHYGVEVEVEIHSGRARIFWIAPKMEGGDDDDYDEAGEVEVDAKATYTLHCMFILLAGLIRRWRAHHHA